LLKLKYIRKLYPDPMTKSGKWKVLHPDSLVQTGQAGTIVQTGGGKSNPEVKTGGTDDDDTLNSKDKDSDEEPEIETTGPVVGVVSRSKKTSIRLYNNQTTYNKWVFAFALQQQQQQQQQQNGNPGNPKGGKPGTPGSNGNRPPQQNPPPNSFGNPPPGSFGNPPPPQTPPDNNNQDDDSDNQ